MPKASAIITSRQNPLLKELQKIRDDRNSPLLFLEGPRLIQEALNAKCQLEFLVISEQFPKISFLEPLRGHSKQVFEVSDSVFKVVSDVENPQGLLAIGRKPSWDWKDLLKRSPAPVVVLDGLQDPGNAASIARSAEAAGAAGIVTTPGTVRLYSPKALRGAMGSTLRLPILEHVPRSEMAEKFAKGGFGLVQTEITPRGNQGIPHTKMDWKKGKAVIFGQEGKGIPDPWKVPNLQYVFIPMEKPVESLNVAAAAAVLLYEAFRQRN